MSSNDLQIGSAGADGSSAFTQSGQVDWVAFATTVWRCSSSILQRFASAGVQPVTYGAGLALASQFQLDHVGEERMDDALQRLSGFWGYEKMLWFGFGIKSFVKMMKHTQPGINCIALCSALAEIHSEDASAWILEELWKELKNPQEFQPSHAQFVTLVAACNGVLAKTSFSSTADKMLGHVLHQSRSSITASEPKDTAKALQGLFQISTGKISRITIRGGKECAFFAALADWLFNFTVFVEDVYGALIHHTASPEEAQVHVIYGRGDELSLVQVSSTSFILRDCKELIDKSGPGGVLLAFKTPWDGCLHRVFGPRLDDMIGGLSPLLGNFLGSAARVYKALAEGEPNVANFSRKAYTSFVEASYGRGFVDSAVSIFPELKRAKPLVTAMEKAADDTFANALTNVQLTVYNLSRACQCFYCSNDDSNRDQYENGSCHLAMAMTIRHLISTVSCTTREPEILPTTHGIQNVCTFHTTSLWNLKGETTSSEAMLSLALGLKIESIPWAEGDRYRNRNSSLLAKPMEIFSTHDYRDLRSGFENRASPKETRTAEVRDGICFYLDCLQSVSSRADMAGVVHIVPGHIQKDEKQYKAIEDSPSFVMRPFQSAPIQHGVIDSEPTNILVHRQQSNLRTVPIAVDTASEHNLRFYYRIFEEGQRAYHLQPGHLTEKILEFTGLPVCTKVNCASRLAFPCRLVQEGWEVPDYRQAGPQETSNLNLKCYVWPQMDEPARCMAISLARAQHQVYLRKGECLACCTENITQRGHQFERPDDGYYHIF